MILDLMPRRRDRHRINDYAATLSTWERQNAGEALAADPRANFIGKNPTVVMLALGFLLMIGAVLIADGVGVHVPKGYIYAAMAFSTLVEMLNIFSRRRQQRRTGARTDVSAEKIGAV